jgi:hypothetical protein
MIDMISPSPPGNEAVVSTLWIPARGEHTCIKVDIAPQIGEISVGNNLAQENIAVFDSAGSSSHEPVELDTVVRNPYPSWKLIHLQVRGLPDGWFTVINHGWVWVPPRGQKPLKIVIWTIKDTPDERDQHQKVPVEAFVRIEGWTTQMHRLLPIGGLTAIVKANHKVDIKSIDVQASLEKPIVVDGSLIPPLANIPITIEVIDPEGKSHLLHTLTDDHGSFHTDRVLGREPYILQQPGKYTVQAFVTSGADAAETESKVISFKL